jgi:hypothetical protein
LTTDDDPASRIVPSAADAGVASTPPATATNRAGKPINARERLIERESFMSVSSSVGLWPMAKGAAEDESDTDRQAADRP